MLGQFWLPSPCVEHLLLLLSALSEQTQDQQDRIGL